MSYDEDVLTSLHEAGHAVAAVLLGGEVRSVTMEPPQCISRELDPWSRAVVCCAGSAAARALGPQVRSEARVMSSQDLDVAKLNLSRLGPGYWLQDAQAEARTLVSVHGSAVRRVAEALRKAGELSGLQVERLVAGEAIATVLASAASPSAARIPSAPAVAPRSPAAEGLPTDRRTLLSWRERRLVSIDGALSSYEGGYISKADTETRVAELEAEIDEIDAALAAA